MSNTQTSSILSASKIEELRALFDETYARHQVNDSELGLWRPVYEALYNAITDFSGIDEPKPGVDRQSWLWLRGARFVNAGVGPFAELIRQYTIIQHEQRYGFPPKEDEFNNELNRSSNNIAVNFIGQWLGYDPVDREAPPIGGTVPTIFETGIEFQGQYT